MHGGESIPLEPSGEEKLLSLGFFGLRLTRGLCSNVDDSMLLCLDGEL